MVDTRQDLEMFTANNLAMQSQSLAGRAGVDAPLVIHSGPDYDSGSLRISTLSGDGLFFNDDA